MLIKWAEFVVVDKLIDILSIFPMLLVALTFFDKPTAVAPMTLKLIKIIHFTATAVRK